MTSFFRSPIRLGALLTLGLAACSGDEGGGALFIESCSLGCSSGNGGAQVFCSIVNTAVNQEFAIVMSEPIDPDSITNQTFRVLDTSNGSTPLGEVMVDSTNSRRLIFRPSLTFDNAGNPSYGFQANTSYQFLIPGAGQGGSGNYIRSTKGRKNQSRLECTVLTDQGIIDPVDGDPSITSITVTAVTATDPDGNPTEFEEVELDSPEGAAATIWRRSPIVVVFDEPMNPATLFNPSTGTSSSVLIRLDVDGNLETSDDRIDVSGRFDVDIDLDSSRTTLTFLHEIPNPDGGGFIPTGGFPSAGEDEDNPRLVTMVITNTVADIVGNKVTENTNGLLYSFTPESIPQPALILPGGSEDEGGNPFLSEGVEDFDDTDLLNVSRSGALWADGRLQKSEGGGSGRLGELVISAGTTTTFMTDDDEIFPRGVNPANDLVFTPEELDDQAMNGTPAQIVVDDGIFEFSALTIEPGATLRFEGANSARIYVRGPVSIPAGSIIDLSGGTPDAHDSRHPDPMTTWVSGVGTFIADPVVPGIAGPSGGDGGYGGARFLFTNAVTGVGGSNATQLDMWVDGDTYGRPGEPVGGHGATSGLGGSRYPTGPYPTGTNFPTAESLAINVIPYSIFTAPPMGCFSRMVGGSGSGGGYSMAGTDGASVAPETQWEFPAPPGDNAPADTTAGDLVPGLEDMGVESPNFSNTGYDIRTLDPNNGNLLGGSGGGGGGSHPFMTYYDGIQDLIAGGNCEANASTMDSAVLGENAWVDHSGASGGGGGGAIMISSGTSIELNGIIDASGGNGGINLSEGTEDRIGAWAMPGGGGSGGAVLLQSRSVSISGSPGRIDVSGGQGGSTIGITDLGTGGDGSPGLVRIEEAGGGPPDAGGSDHAVYDQSISPFDGGGAFGTFSVNFLSVDPGGFDGAEVIPDSYSASMSCWIRPPGNFLNINFTEDPDGSPDDDEPEDLGWNLHLVWDDGGGEVNVPLRGDVGGAISNSILAILRRNQLNQDQADATLRSPIAVRFQAATISGELLEPCIGYAPPIVASTLTPWVEHPSELNPEGSDAIPDVFRFAVFFDGSAIGTADLDDIQDNLQGITNLWVRADPD